MFFYPHPEFYAWVYQKAQAEAVQQQIKEELRKFWVQLYSPSMN